MRIFLPFLCVLCATPVHTIFDGSCLRKDPPPGVLILSPGRDLVLTCSGHVTVDGVKVRDSSNTKRVVGASQTTVNSLINTAVLIENEKHALENAVSQISQNRSLRHRDTGYTTSPTAHMVQSTSLPKAEEMDKNSDYQEEDEEEGSRVTRGINSRPLWKWTRGMVGKRDQGATTRKREDTLTLSSVRLTDSGTYSCHHGGRKRFSLQVIIADPPEEPSLSCYKKSPSSGIVCVWTPQRPVTIRPDCYLLLSKSPTDAFLPLQCSYSSRASRCWCALDHNEDELRTAHMAYLCVTSMAGNATSSLLHFTPLSILKPDPPSNVSVRQEEGQETRMMVTWSLPASWKNRDYFFKLIYEIKYRPLESSYRPQIQRITDGCFYSIPDAMPGVEYLIQLRTREEYDGLWSDWSTPVCATSWTAPMSTTTMIPVYEDMGNSDIDYNVTDVVRIFSEVSTQSAEVSAHIFWIFGSFTLFSVILAAYIFRHKDRLMTKVQCPSVFTQCGASPLPPPSATTAPEGQALVTFGPPSNGKTPLIEAEEREEVVCCSKDIEKKEKETLEVSLEQMSDLGNLQIRGRVW